MITILLFIFLSADPNPIRFSLIKYSWFSVINYSGNCTGIHIHVYVVCTYIKDFAIIM